MVMNRSFKLLLTIFKWWLALEVISYDGGRESKVCLLSVEDKIEIVGGFGTSMQLDL